MEIKRFGSIYIDSVPQPAITNCAYAPGVLSIGNASSEATAIEWLDDGKCLYATKTLIRGVSAADLMKAHFFTGRIVRIDGTAFLCRCFQAENDDFKKNEWVALMDGYTDQNVIWHWDEVAFWVQDGRARDREYLCTVMGLNSSREEYTHPADNRTSLVGFRPVLERLGDALTLSPALKGKYVKIIGMEGGVVNGKILSYDDYDIIVQGSWFVEPCSWAKRDGKDVVIDRHGIRHIQALVLE